MGGRVLPEVAAVSGSLSRKRARTGHALAALRRRCEADGVVTVDTPVGLKKISDALVDVAAPLLDSADHTPSQKSVAAIVGIAATVWNVGSLSSATPASVARARVAFEREFNGPPFLVQSVFELLLKRRHELYPDDTRVVTDYTIRSDGAGGYRISAAFQFEETGR